MKTKHTAALLLVSTFLAAAPFAFAAVSATELTALVTDAARWESGQHREPLVKLEQLVRESVADRKMRADLETALLKLLAPEATPEARRFACQQLAVISSDASVPALATLLQSHETAGLACLAFGNRPSTKADEVLLAALPAAQGRSRLQIISTLGNRRVVKAVEPLTPLAMDADAAVAETAIRALGKIGNAPAQKVIAALRSAAGPALARALADASLGCADELVKSGKRKEAAAIYEELNSPAQPAFVRRGAFAGLLRCDGDGGEQRILQTLSGPDTTLKPVAIAAIRQLPSKGASQRFGDELPSLAAAEQVWLIDSLAARNDAAARTAITRALGSADAGVRRAAGSALGQIGNAASVPPLADALVAAKDAEEVRVFISALGGLPGDADTEKAILAEIKRAQGEARANLITSLAARRSPQVLAALFEEAQNPTPLVAKAAYRVLAKAGTDEQLPALLASFTALRNAELRSGVEGFVEQAVAGTEDPARRSAAVRGAWSRATDLEVRCALLGLLPACGDAEALAALQNASTDSNDSVRDAALRALAEWPDLTAWNALAAAWRKAENETRRSLAFRGLVRLVGEANAHPDATLMARYTELLNGAQSDNDLKLVLGALGGAAHPDALKLALPLLEKTGVRAEAEVAVRKIAVAVQASHPEAAKQALDRLNRK